MANLLRLYFDAKVPLTPKLGPPAPSWKPAWTNMTKQLFQTLPNQLDRARVNRNKFIRAVE